MYYADVLQTALIINRNMNIPLLITLVVVAHAAFYSKLSTLGNNTLTSADYLISALGNIRLTINPPTCQLQIQSFQTSTYVIYGYYPRQAQLACQNLTIVNNSLISDSKNLLLSLPSNQINARFDQVFLTIDQMAIVRISGIYNNRFQTSQNWISIFRSPQQFIYSISNLSVSAYHSLSFIQNSANWGFSATKGELRIFRVDNVSKITRYNYTGFIMTASNFYDYKSNAIPFADIKAFRYQSRCLNNNSNIIFQGPFTFTINPYWPQLRILDQRGYQIVSLRYPQSKCIQKNGQDYLLNSQSCSNWFCPSNMFQHNGTCVTSCPSPFFHQLGRNGINRCILTCQTDQIRDTVLRICSCRSVQSYNCDTKYKSTPFGCLCPNGTYFNNVNLLSNADSCLSSCGPFYYPHQDGICVPCPKNCLKCTLSGYSFSYLKCTACQQTYNLNDDNVCIRSCSYFIGKTILNGSCVNCLVRNCRNCSSNLYTCSSCLYPFSLYNNSCLNNCPSGFKSNFRQDNTFQCRPIPKCLSPLIETIEINNQSRCFCFSGTKNTYLRACFNSTAPCKLSQYYSPNTKQCLACPISCLTCVLDNLNRVECTSCRPQYSLFITLSKNHYCQRNSILSICTTNYNQITQTCTVNNFQSTAAMLSNRNACFKNIRNCSICIWGSDSLCSFCRAGFYLFIGQCFSQCPINTTTYRIQAVCIVQTLQNCLVQTTQNSYLIFNKNLPNQIADAFYYLVSANFQNSDMLNDPIGSFFIYSSQTNSKSRQVNIAYSYQKCTACEQGYGLNTLGYCVPCELPCLKCIYARTTVGSCLKCDLFHKLTIDNNCEKLNPIDTPCQSGEYRNESLVCQVGCSSFYRPNYQLIQNGKNFTVNCTFNCPSNYKIVSKNQNETLSCQLDNSSEDSSYIKFFGMKFSSFNVTVYYFITSIKLKYSNQTIKLSKKLLSRTLTQMNQPNIYKIQFGFIVMDRNDDNTPHPLLLQLQASTIEASSKGDSVYLGNSIYGYNSNTQSTLDIIQNQTYNLHLYGRAFTIIMLVFTVIFLSQLLSYKTDNVFITFSMIYLTLPSLNLFPSASHFNSYSFLYGFSWSSYLQMFSNPRSLSEQTSWFNNYIDMPHNNAHLILFVDNNILRNCWSIFLFLIIVGGILIVFITIFRCFSVKDQAYLSKNKELNFYEGFKYSWQKIGYNHIDFDHSHSVALLLAFFIQNSFLALTYYSFMNLGNLEWQLAPASKLMNFKILSIIILAFIAIYSLLRFFTNRIAGIYCLKRLMLGCYLGLINILGGIDQNLILSLLLLIKSELIFVCLRMRYELIPTYTPTAEQIFQQNSLRYKNHRKIKYRNTIGDKPTQQIQIQNQMGAVTSWKNEGQNIEYKKKVYIIGQQALIILLYIFLCEVNVLKEISILIIWIILNIFIASFGLDIFDMMLSLWLHHCNNRSSQQGQFYKKIKSIWDYDKSLKNLTQITTDF